MKRDAAVTNVFCLFVVLHVLAWTLAPAWLRFTLPMDAMEGATWGHQLAFGYDKNPFMNAWLTRLALTLGGQWTVYLFSQTSVAVCFWAVWRLGCKMVSPLIALLGVMLLEGLQYYNFHAIDFNDNTLELSLWALLILFFYDAVHDGKMRDWVGVGVFAGLGLMTKYYTVVLIFPLFLFLFCTPETRRTFSKLGIYVAALICLLVSAPHITWLFSHDFVTVHYAFVRTGSEPVWWSHVRFPVEFVWQQAEVLLPGITLMLPLFLGRSTPVISGAGSLHRFDRLFLIAAGLGPLVFTVLLSITAGLRLRAGWGQPLLSYAGLLLLVSLRPILTVRRLRNFAILWGVFFVTALAGYSIALISARSFSSANYPGNECSQRLVEWWHAHSSQPLKYVVGPRWMAGNVAFYAKDHPAVYMEADSRVSPWVNMADLSVSGALFVWGKADWEFEKKIRTRFPLLGATRIFYFPLARQSVQQPPLAVAAALLLPSKSAFTHERRISLLPESAR